jgi:dipeptidase E
MGGAQTVHFAPYALAEHDGYTARVSAAVAPLGVAVHGLHVAGDPFQAVKSAEVLFVGGGNTFRLLRALQQLGLLDLVRERASSGELRYVGSSAGTNLACPTIRTTNDIPIVETAGLAALGLVPFQINPHYLDPVAGSTHMGETREQRLLEFLEENDGPVLGLRDGAYLRRSSARLTLGAKPAHVCCVADKTPRTWHPGWT